MRPPFLAGKLSASPLVKPAEAGYQSDDLHVANRWH
jgi:hypothetical protein